MILLRSCDPSQDTDRATLCHHHPLIILPWCRLCYANEDCGAELEDVPKLLSPSQDSLRRHHHRTLFCLLEQPTLFLKLQVGWHWYLPLHRWARGREWAGSMMMIIEEEDERFAYNLHAMCLVSCPFDFSACRGGFFARKGWNFPGLGGDEYIWFGDLFALLFVLEFSSSSFHWRWVWVNVCSHADYSNIGWMVVVLVMR